MDGEICCCCYGDVDENNCAMWCQSSAKMCCACLAHRASKCEMCNTPIEIKEGGYVLDGMPECRPWCSECIENEK